MVRNSDKSVYIRCGSHLVIQDLKGHLRSPKLVSYVLSENVEDGLEWPLTSAHILCPYKSHRLYISN